MAASATVNQTRSNGRNLRDVPNAVLRDRTLAVGAGKLALEQLPAAPDGTKGVTADNEAGRVGRHNITAARPDLFGQRFGYALIYEVRSESLIDELPLSCEAQPDSGKRSPSGPPESDSDSCE